MENKESSLNERERELAKEIAKINEMKAEIAKEKEILLRKKNEATQGSKEVE